MVILSYIYRFVSNFLLLALVYFSLNFLEKYQQRAIVEWVPKDDPQTRRLLVAREDIFPGYHLQGFEAAFTRNHSAYDVSLDGKLVRGDAALKAIYEALRDTFVGDDISRIRKGQPGADVRHRVLYKGGVCGTILVDSKNRQGWQNAYVTKLREDQVADNADHALLATTVFPSGKKELYIDQETGVVVVSRTRAIEIVRLLREAMVRMHCLGLSLEQRAEKRDLLYKYLTSENYRQHLGEANRVTSDLLELDTEEKRAHDKVWEKRGRMTMRLRNVVRSIDTEVSAIIEGRAGAQN